MIPARGSGPTRPSHGIVPVRSFNSAPSRRRRPLADCVLTAQRLGPRGYLALGICIASLLIAVVGIALERSLSTVQNMLRAETLQEILDAKTAALEMWLDHEQEKIESWARSKEIQPTRQRTGAVRDPGRRQLGRSQGISPAAGHPKPNSSDWRAPRRNTSSGTPAISLSPTHRPAVAIIGRGVTPCGASRLTEVFEGRSCVLPYGSGHTITKRNPLETIRPQLCFITPIDDSQGRHVAALMVHDPDARTRAAKILRMERLRTSAESYAFNREGQLLSKSRFTDQLRQSGLLPNDAVGPGAEIGLVLRDPGGDLTTGYRPREPLSTRPLTKMARHAISGGEGVDVDGYRDYRGVMVIGAWRWLSEYDMGLATEMDLRESQPGHWVAALAAWIIFALFAASLAVIVVSFYSIQNLRQQIGEESRLGQYVLERQIGEGGMGKVFKARHAFLKRPTAIKLLKPDLVDPASTERFEREANLASQLTHPNTVDIYDYGVTPEGVLYYVMEFVDGPALSELVQRFGPLPPARAVYFLSQVCQSLREAHGQGLIHRDLKPQNIMVCQRGGQADVIKVLDFGLVKRVHPSESQSITATAILAGTPRYIAPECWQDPNRASPRSDIYAVGAVGFFLLTGRDVFEGTNFAEIMVRALQEEPRHPAEMSPEIPVELDQLIVNCLAKNPTERPQDVGEMLDVLKVLARTNPWEPAMANGWWKEHFPN